MSERKLNERELSILEKDRLAENPKYGEISHRLRQLFWDSSCNDITLRFYRRLQDEAIYHGEPVYRSIKACASSAQVARSPVRYFAASITRRLREQGYLLDGGDDTGL